MLRNDDQWLAVTDSFYAAAFDERRWYSALEGLAEATGSSHGELITLGPGVPGPVHIFTNVEPGLLEAFDRLGGSDPDVNPRVKAGTAARDLTVLAEEDFITPAEHKRHPHYQEFARPWGIPYICLAPLERTQELLVGLSVGRSERDGHITKKQREIFASIAPHVRGAVRAQLAVGNHGTQLLTGALEALALAAFVVDQKGSVRALTPSAETLLGGQKPLQLASGRLRARRAEDSKALRDAIDAVCRGLRAPGERPLTRAVVVRNADESGLPTVLDVVPLPARRCEFNFSARVLIVARGVRDANARKRAILQTAYRLTAAEVDIALKLAAGQSAQLVATRRRVAVGTVRTQIKNIFAKMGVSRQIELVARIGQL